MKKNNTLNFILYLILSFYFQSFLLINNQVIFLSSDISFFIPIIFFIMAILLFFLLPKQKHILNNKLLQVLKSIYYLINTLVLLIISSYIISSMFFNNMSYILIILILLLMILLFSFFKKNQIFDISLTLFIVAFLFNFIFLLNTSIPKFNLLYNLKLNNILSNNYFLSFSFFYVFLEPILFYLDTDLDNDLPLKKILIPSLIVGSILSSIMIFINFLYYPTKYLLLSKFPAFQAIMTFLGPEFLDHFSIIILLNTIIITLLKGAYNIKNINILKSIKFNNMFVFILLFILTNIVFYFFDGYMSVCTIFGILLLIILLLIYFLIISIYNKERRHSYEVSKNN